MTEKEICKMYNKNKKAIAKLYNGYTPIKTIEELTRQNEIALKNELKKIGL